LARVPYRDDLLRFRDCFALGLGALGLGSGFGGCSLSILARRLGPIAGGYRRRPRMGKPGSRRASAMCHFQTFMPSSCNLIEELP
jgi:hypothetical protein